MLYILERKVIIIARKRLSPEEKKKQDQMVKEKIKEGPKIVNFNFVVHQDQVQQISDRHATFDIKHLVDRKKKVYIVLKSIEQLGCVSPCDVKKDKKGLTVAVKNVNKKTSEYRMIEIPYRRIAYDGPLVIYDLETNIPKKTLQTQAEMIKFFDKFEKVPTDYFKIPKLFGH